jgi:ubiquinone/menaquinone biosynthesis C-methylase UbiE
VRGRILDVACGTGYGSQLLARSAEVWGLDYDTTALDLARQRVPHGRFVLGELPYLPWESQYFDAVVCFETIEHVADDRRLIGELSRVLRPGALLLLSTPNAEVTSPHGTVQNPWHVREYVLSELYDLLRAGDFEEIEVFYQGLPDQNLPRRQAHRVVARFPVLCRPGRWWDALAHGKGEVWPWTEGRLATIWIVRCRRAL